MLAVLAQLREHEHYGYTMRKTLAVANLEIDEGTLYPLLRRLEAQGLLLSEWREEDKRSKRFPRGARRTSPPATDTTDTRLPVVRVPPIRDPRSAIPRSEQKLHREEALNARVEQVRTSIPRVVRLRPSGVASIIAR